MAEPKIIRSAAEVIGQETATANSNALVRRSTAEVIGQETATANAVPKVNRAITEVLASSARLGKGLRLPNIAVTDYTLFMMVRPRNWSMGSKHMFGITDSFPGKGIFIQQSDTATNEINLRIHNGLNGVVTAAMPVAATNDKGILTVRCVQATNTVTARYNRTDFPTTVGGTLAPMVLSHLGAVIEDSMKQNAAVAQVLLYANAMDLPLIEQVENYLYCKWVTPGPSEENNYCLPA